MDNATVDVINSMFYHFYKKNIPKEKLALMKDGIISPASLVNIRFQSKNSTEFLKHVLNKFT